eukprot:359710-Chlamydomonas_euryale.AAC.3
MWRRHGVSCWIVWRGCVWDLHGLDGCECTCAWSVYEGCMGRRVGRVVRDTVCMGRRMGCMLRGLVRMGRCLGCAVRNIARMARRIGCMGQH